MAPGQGSQGADWGFRAYLLPLALASPLEADPPLNKAPRTPAAVGGGPLQTASPPGSQSAPGAWPGAAPVYLTPLQAWVTYTTACVFHCIPNSVHQKICVMLTHLHKARSFKQRSSGTMTAPRDGAGRGGRHTVMLSPSTLPSPCRATPHG